MKSSKSTETNTTTEISHRAKEDSGAHLSRRWRRRWSFEIERERERERERENFEIAINVLDVDELTRVLGESVIGSQPKRVRVMQLRNVAKDAVRGGSSTRDLEELVK
ncbi:hypothetical protein HYC85_030015 [Camellia sinensis]|uniref:Uncharacterized protein n=1 Tax=Camellia sinensis TaxID=4442 RepID=A0A7J7G3D4_CAMSI|nr:hypothetical protein HYC85_030015 [Camellia sinensis]